MTRWTAWTGLLVVVAAAVAFFLLGRLTTPPSSLAADADSVWYHAGQLSEATERTLRHAETALRRADSLDAVVRTARAEARHATRAADSLRTVLATVTSAVDSLPLVVAALDSTDEAVNELDAALTVQEAMTIAYRDATDSLRQVVDQERTARLAAIAALAYRPTTVRAPCRVLGLPCPVVVVGPAVSHRGVAGLAVAVGVPFPR